MTARNSQPAAADPSRSTAAWHDGRTSCSRDVLLGMDSGDLCLMDPADRKVLARWPRRGLQLESYSNRLIIRHRDEGDANLEVTSAPLIRLLRKELDRGFLDLPPLTAALLVGAAGLLSLLLMWQGLDAASRMLAESLDPKDEIELAAPLTDTFLSSRCGDQAVYDILQKTARRLGGKNPVWPSWKFAIVKDPVANAMALPGGLIVIHSGLIREAKTPDEITGVLAHEMAHVQHRHMTRSIIRNSALAIPLMLLLGDVSQILLIDPSNINELVARGFSRDTEREADLGALTMLKSAGITSRGLRRFFLRQEKGGDLPAFLSTHPGGEERATAIRRFGETGKDPGLSHTDWQVLRSACERST